MIVIGMNDQGYICQVGHTELEKLTDKYCGNLPKLKVGYTMDLGAGHNFRSDIQSACDGMAKAVKNFDEARMTMTKFAVMVAGLPGDEQEKGNESN